MALALFSITFVTLLGVFSRSARVMASSEERICAQTFAQRILEEQRSKAFDSLAAYSGAAVASVGKTTLDFAYSVTVSTLEEDTLKDVAVKVTWTSGSVTRETLLETAILR